MELIFALAIGILAAAATYLFLARDLPRMILGFILLGLAANFTIFVGGRLANTAPPLVARGAEALAEGASNPLPQALVLTAIVIGFGLAAFTLTLVLKAQQTFGTVNVDEMHAAEGRHEEGSTAAAEVPVKGSEAEPPVAGKRKLENV